MLLSSTVWIWNSLINLFVFRMVVFAFVLSVRMINLLLITQYFGSDPSIFRFNVINLSTIICGVSVVALLVPAWIITVSRSSCNKSFSFCCMSSILPPGIGCTQMWCVFDNLLSSMPFTIESPTTSTVFFFIFLYFVLAFLLSFLFLWLIISVDSGTILILSLTFWLINESFTLIALRFIKAWCFL